MSAPRSLLTPIEIALVCGSIADTDALLTEDADQPDAVAVGHYVGVRPQGAELALDRALSRPLPGKTHHGTLTGEANLLLTQLSERGTIQGELAQPFFLPDPRPAKDDQTAGRVIAIAGMGVVGRFGAPELCVLVRELCWALGRMGKRHLATVLIGSGKGNLRECEAVGAWLRGLAQALAGSPEDRGRRLERVTFVECDPGRIKDIQNAILAEKEQREVRRHLRVAYPKQLDDAALLALKARPREQQDNAREDSDSLPIPTRITVALEQKTYRFGAITESASIPERQISVDPELVMEANDELAAASDPERQFERGEFLERLLFPDDLRRLLYSNAPLVMMLDATTARIHWELFAQPDLGALGEDAPAPPDLPPDRAHAFLGTSRGFTRQLRTTFAPPPEPPPPPRRVLRVLVVADPAADAPLPGARQEGEEVAALFESYNAVWKNSPGRVEVVRLIGPAATRTTVLSRLMLHTFDVLHFAGHCVYDAADPAASGWIFSNGKRLSARELSRVDRIPKFVFSNACESGITPDRCGERSADLAPSFAEAFFARGVSNFVCTAWPVDDVGAKTFALQLYAGLLNLTGDGKKNEDKTRQRMHAAMQQARLRVAEGGWSVQTWGAYQHYGNPYLRFFDTGEDEEAEKNAAEKKRKTNSKPVKSENAAP